MLETLCNTKDYGWNYALHGKHIILSNIVYPAPSPPISMLVSKYCCKGEGRGTETRRNIEWEGEGRGTCRVGPNIYFILKDHNLF